MNGLKCHFSTMEIHWILRHFRFEGRFDVENRLTINLIGIRSKLSGKSFSTNRHQVCVDNSKTRLFQWAMRWFRGSERDGGTGLNNLNRRMWWLKCVPGCHSVSDTRHIIRIQIKGLHLSAARFSPLTFICIQSTGWAKLTIVDFKWKPFKSKWISPKSAPKSACSY